MTGEASNKRLIDHAITKANDMVIGASFAIMESDEGPARTQARYFQSLFTAIRNVLQYGQDDESPAELELARAVVGADSVDGVSS